MDHTLDQKRAMHSLERVKEIEKKHKNQGNGQFADDYAGYVVRLPADILSNGLGQALAQLLAAAKDKKEDPHRLVYQDLQSWLCRDDEKAPYPGAADLLEAIVSNDRRRYQWALAEALAWLEWHKKLSVAYLKKSEGESQ
ncbi:type III-B CRISPR module-associated protein Cmr5 [Lihuaxuella thermophila]|uniref:CRISPR type III-B/RAMP module-associated protein Cmr5 n=1 Tax=Lihuaxuella thermophila TaxID=1173111 RepID=A0A1H8IKS5_9BACL|nr:type III-B CRISPR module-associated protein Cmr5 [Lihuaxuella thermophila]SEN68942.1 CRISPR-associated protein Cmr5 [Lihuaxuella thermophila]